MPTTLSIPRWWSGARAPLHRPASPGARLARVRWWRASLEAGTDADEDAAAAVAARHGDDDVALVGAAHHGDDDVALVGAAHHGDDDVALVVAARHGDPDAFDELVRRHAGRLHAVARRLVGPSDAADAVQECLMTAYQSLARFRGEARFTTYLHAILVRQCRRRTRHAGRFAPWPDGEVASVGPGPVEHAERRELQHHVARALAQLPPRFREALVLRESAGLEYQDVARALGVPVGTVRSRIARARARLRAAFERDGVAP